MMYDYIIVGAGISGASAAYELAPFGSVLLLEAESMPGYHSTGRSAALYTRYFGGPTIRRINAASHDFFINPATGFCAQPLLTPRGGLTIAAPGQEGQLKPILELSRSGAEIEKITAVQALELAPLLHPERVAAAAYERGVMDIDVSALHQSYLRGYKQRGGLTGYAQQVTQLNYIAAGGGHWQATTAGASVSGRILVNAAGAWADLIGAMAGAISIGLIPKRRTGIIIDAPQGINVSALPVIDFVATDAYIKPDAGRIMASPGDQTPMEPQDVQPDESDIALLVDWLQTETRISVQRISHSWAGLRSFVEDQVPVVGFDPKIPNFFWLAGQGGYGIMMAPTLARATMGLIVSGSLPADFKDKGIKESDLSPMRLC